MSMTSVEEFDRKSYQTSERCIHNVYVRFLIRVRGGHGFETKPTKPNFWRINTVLID